MRKYFVLFVFLFLAVPVLAQEPEYEPVKLFGVELSVILSVVFGTLAALAGGFWNTVRLKLAQVAGLLLYISQAVEDNKVTQEEEKEIVRRVRELLGSGFLSKIKIVKP